MRQQKTIFRPDALRRYDERKEKVVLPLLVSPRLGPVLWVLFGLLAACVLLAVLTKVPVYAKVPAFVVERRGDSTLPANRVLLAVSLPSETAGKLMAGRRVTLSFGEEGRAVSVPVRAVDQEILDAQELRSRFGPAADSGVCLGNQPGFALVAVELNEADAHASHSAGGCYEAQVEIGTRRLLPLLD
jgi:hypothetical protein